MKLFVLAAREMAEQKLVWAAAVFVAFWSVILPHLKGVPADMSVASIALNLGYILAVSLVLGAAAIPADLAARRLGFYLARPVGTGTLLAGRLLGVWLLALGGGAVVVLPQVVLQVTNLGEWAVLLGFGAGLSLFAILLGHLLGMAWRSRSAWILLDLGALGAFGWAVGNLVRRVMDLGAFRAVPYLMGGLALLVLGVMIAAAYLGLERGREDLQRGHRVMAFVLAGGLAGAALAGVGFTAWVGAEAPTSLETFQVTDLAPQGDWLALRGEGRFGRARSLVLNAATGAALEAPSWGCFSGDGQRYLWLGGMAWDLSLHWADLGGDQKTRGSLQVPGGRDSIYGLMAINRDGDLAAIQRGSRLLVVDCKAGRVLWNQEMEGKASYKSFHFLPGRVLRMYPLSGSKDPAIREMDLATGTWVDTGRLPGSQGRKYFDEAHGHLFIQRTNEITVCDARSGAVLGRVEPVFAGSLQSLVAREDGTIAVLECSRDRAMLRVFEAGGRELWSQPLPPPMAGLMELVVEPATGRILILRCKEAAPGPLEGDLLAADPRAATLGVEAADALVPPWYGNSGQTVFPLASRLRMPNRGGLLYLDKDRAPRIVLRKARWSWTPPT